MINCLLIKVLTIISDAAAAAKPAVRTTLAGVLVKYVLAYAVLRTLFEHVYTPTHFIRTHLHKHRHTHLL